MNLPAVIAGAFSLASFGATATPVDAIDRKNVQQCSTPKVAQKTQVRSPTPQTQLLARSSDIEYYYQERCHECGSDDTVGRFILRARFENDEGNFVDISVPKSGDKYNLSPKWPLEFCGDDSVPEAFRGRVETKDCTEWDLPW